jgi:hypothetical protein
VRAPPFLILISGGLPARRYENVKFHSRVAYFSHPGITTIPSFLVAA